MHASPAGLPGAGAPASRCSASMGGDRCPRSSYAARVTNRHHGMLATFATVLLLGGATSRHSWPEHQKHGQPLHRSFSARRPQQHPAKTPPLGFNHCNIACGKGGWNASMQMKMMDAMIARDQGKSLRDAGYRFANLDDGWMLAPPAVGPRRGGQVADPAWLAAGGLTSMSGLVKYAHERNLSFGLYTARGGITCGGFEASCGQEELDAQQYAAWGVDYVKDDDCSPCSGNYDADYTRMGLAIADSQRPMALMVEGIPDARVLSAGCTGVTMKRVGHDVAPTWRSVSSNFDLTSGLAHLAHSDQSGDGRCSFWNDLSLLQVHAPPTEAGYSDFNCDENTESLAMCRAHVGMYSVLKSPLIISAWLPSMASASREVLTNQMLLEINQDKEGAQARRVKSVPPSNTTISGPRDAFAVLAHCDAEKSTQHWHTSSTFASDPIQILITQPCNSLSPRQKFTFTDHDELRQGRLCIDSNTSAACLAGMPCQRTLLQPCAGGVTQKWTHDAATNQIRQLDPAGSSHALCLTGSHYSQEVTVDLCEPATVNRSVSANQRSSEVWSVVGISIRPGSSNSFLVAADQCLAAADLLMASTTLWTQDSDGHKWWLSSHGDPGIIEVHDDPQRTSSSTWTVSNTGETFSSQPAVVVASGLCLSWSSEYGASGPLPFTRHMLIEAQQRLNGGGCANGAWTIPTDGKPGAVKPATDAPLDSNDHVGSVTSLPASSWCLDVTRGGNLETWTGPLSEGRHVVALLNRSPSPEVMSLSFADDLGLPSSTTWNVFDVWSKQTLEYAFKSSSRGVTNLARHVAAHGVEIMVLVPSS